MGRQWNAIIDALSGGTMSINANLTDIEALLTTLQADVADGIKLDSGSAINGQLSIASDGGGSVPSYGVQIGYYDLGADEFTIANNSNRFPVDATGSVSITSGTTSVSSGTISANLRDESGNGITSTTSGGKRRLDVMLASAGTTGSAVPTSANLYAGTDGTNLRAISTDTTGRININQTYGTTTIGTLTAGTTNGTLFASNANRKYLLVQCTSGTAFIDTNGTATTANGIQLTSGQGITFEASFIPTGAIAGITSTGTAQLIGRQG